MSEQDRRLAEAARAETLLVASDLDGTLAPLIDDPAQVQPDVRAVTALRALAALPRTHAAVVSGRARADLVRMFGPSPALRLIGSHGYETDNTGGISLSPAALEQRDRIVARLSQIAASAPGFVVEVKPATVAFHYRMAERGAAERALQEILASPEAQSASQSLHGTKVLELGVVPLSKGRSLAELRCALGATCVVFLGDDVTDEDAFAALADGDLGVKVGLGPTRAELRISGPADVVDVLVRLAALREAVLRPPHAMPIEQLSLLSDQRTVALTDPEGGIVWACFPRLDSPALFAELLGGPAAGSFRIRPAAPGGRPVQEYVGDSLVLRTRWPKLTVTDYLDCASGRAYQRAGRSELLRIIEGDAPAIVTFAPRLDFGRTPTRFRVVENGLEVDGGIDPIVLYAPGVAWQLTDDGPHQTASAEITPGGEPMVIELRYGTGNTRSAFQPEPRRREMTERFWSLWAAQLTLPPLAQDLVRRSALVLKALCYGPTGAIAAAATTSLPECLSGVRNWDYRYCWVRDGTLAATSLVRLGNTGVAMKFLDWLLGVLDHCQSPERLSPLYTVRGQALGPEAELGHLPGYRGSRPVRIGNAASTQIQLDVFGPVVELVTVLARHGAPISTEHWRLVEAMVTAVQRRWQEPDHGIWETRGPRQHFVHSKLMCWLAADRASLLAELFLGQPRPEWAALRDEIRTDILANGYDAEQQTFVCAYGNPALDAAALLIGCRGLLSPDDPRYLGTIAAVERELLSGACVYRYRFDDGLPGTEGAFLLCTAWLIEAYWRVGREDDARRLFDGLTHLAGPTLLLPEEYCPLTQTALGNYPQAYSHVGIIDAAVCLSGLDGG